MRRRIKWRDFVQTKAYKRVERVLARFGLRLVIVFEGDPAEAKDVFVINAPKKSTK